MGELSDYFKKRWLDKSSVGSEIRARMQLKAQILNLCNEMLMGTGNESFVFEVEPNSLHFAVMVITDEPLKSLFDIVQLDESLFRARLVEIDLDEG